MLDTKMQFTKTDASRMINMACDQMGEGFEGRKEFVDKLIDWYSNNPIDTITRETAPMPEVPKTGVYLIAVERQEQIEKHGFSVEQDKQYYSNNELIKGALFCISTENFEWPYKWDGIFRKKILKKDRIDQLKIAGALIAAEIDRLKAIDTPQ